MFIDFPEISPIIFSIGPIMIRWYALAYLLGITFAFYFIKFNIKKYNFKISSKELDDLIFYATLGIILGGRIGYIICYGKGYFLGNPLEIFAIWHGGMSFHGGIVGVIFALLYFSKKQNIKFLTLTDLAAICTPIGIFFGRIANFINDELWGRVTDIPFAVKFPSGGYLPRHPSQLYEAITEGVLTFIILNILWRKPNIRNNTGAISAIFLILYSISRISMEVFREPDNHIGLLFNSITMGQLLSTPFLFLGIYILIKSFKTKN